MNSKFQLKDAILAITIVLSETLKDLDFVFFCFYRYNPAFSIGDRSIFKCKFLCILDQLIVKTKTDFKISLTLDYQTPE